jgi:hypothetical protein
MSQEQLKRKQINFRPSEELLRDLKMYQETMGYRSLPQTVYFLVSEALDERLRERGLKENMQ